MIPSEPDAGNADVGMESRNLWQVSDLHPFIVKPLMIKEKEMKRTKRMLCLTVLGGLSVSSAVQAQGQDSLRLAQMQEVVVSGVRVRDDAPFAVTNVKYKELQQHSRTGRELPMLLSRTPGVLAWGENGLGTGTSYMRIRGAGDSRINVTLDGVPLNSPEDQCVFWANMNSYASLLGSVQVQRGVGSSTNGDGAFGGTIALSMATPSSTPRAEINYSLGSYNTMNYGVSASTGLLWNHLILEGAWHQTTTDGYLHGTDGRSGSYYGGLTWMPDKRVTLRYRNIGNYEHTGQAWNGVTAGNDDSSLMDGMYLGATGIKTYKDLYDRGLGKYNSLYEQIVYDADNWNFPQDESGNYLTQRYQLSDGSYWRRTTDNFTQNHNLLSAAFDLSDHWTATATLHYTYGYGYYDEFRPQNKLKKFGLSFTDSNGSAVETSDFVRQKGLEQHTYGFVGNARYNDDHWDVIGGLSAQQFKGHHFGYLTYVGHPELAASVLANGRHTYYDSDAEKSDNAFFLKASYRFVPQWSVFADVQYRSVHYQSWGINDKFYKSGSSYYNQGLDIDKHYEFLNPKGGISWSNNGHHAYASVAFSHREPERNNFTDNGSYPAPSAERLLDYEWGYQYQARTWRVGANFYYMDYTDQFVQTGMESDIGEKLTTNIKDSYRLGVELTAGWDITPWLTVEGNAALSRNRLRDFTEAVEDWRDKYAKDPQANDEAMEKYHIDGDGDGFRSIHHGSQTLAFSPSVILNGFLNFHWKGIEAEWHTNFVSRQYLDNTGSRDRSLPSFSTSNLRLQYTLPCNRVAGLRDVIFGVHMSNLFDRHFATSGWVYSALDEKDGFTPDNRYYQIGFIPAAGFTALGSVTLRF